MLIALGRSHLPQGSTLALNDPRVTVHHTDGRAFIKRASGPYDTIIINLPDPMTAQLNRFYTVEFLREAVRIMGPDSVFAISATASENIIGPTLAQYLRSIYRSMKAIFPKVLVYPGGTARFFGTIEGELVSDPHVLVRRIEQRRLNLSYVRDYYVIFNLSPERQDYLQSFLREESGSTLTNRDLKPVCYFYDVVHWSAQYQPLAKRFFLRLSGLNLTQIFVALSLIGVGFFALILHPRSPYGPRAVIPPAVLVSGWTEMTIEIVVILVFQVFYGFLYQKIGMIIAGFMIGLVGGSWLMTRLLPLVRRPLRGLMTVQGGLAGYSLVLLLVVVVLHGLPDISRNLLITEILFPLLTALAGFLGGLHFPLANHAYLEDRRAVGTTAGLVNGIDLLGSAAGALVVGIVILPILGVYQTLLFVFGLNLFAIVLLVIGERTKVQG
jgi:spermidine synthase